MLEFRDAGSAVCLLLVLTGSVSGDVPNFARDVRPVLAAACLTCHGPDAATRKADLRLDEQEGLASVVQPGAPQASELWLRIAHSDLRERMPPTAQVRQLHDREIELVRRWIESGAVWSEHWAFDAPTKPDAPDVTDTAWPRSPIDHFVLSRLEELGLPPSVTAPREKLIRRLSFDLTGLPPTPAAVDAFLADDRPEALEAVVDRLLASPRYGERMATRWLDGARFADSNGYQNDFGRSMWPWRDWVIRSYNENKRYDDFLIEQIAGDLLPAATPDQRLATGFQRNHRTVTEGGAIEEEWRVENVVDRTDTTATVFMGLTFGCARCHDHKYDPISQAEYYSLFAYFNNTTERGHYNEARGNVPTLLRVPTRDNLDRLAELDASIAESESRLVVDPGAAEVATNEWLAQLRATGHSPPPADFALPLNRDWSVNTAESAIVARYTGKAADAKWEDGAFGGSLVLDAKAETRVDLGAATDFDGDDTFTYSVWVRRGNDGAIFSKMDVANAYRGIDLILIRGRPTVHLIHDWPSNAIKVEGLHELPGRTWTHLAFSYDGSGRAEGVHIYVNGEPVSQKVHADTLQGTIRTKEPLRIGGRSSREYYRGVVRDFRAFARVLTEAETQALTGEALVAAASDPLHKDLLDYHRDHIVRGPDSVHGRLKRLRDERRRYFEQHVPTAMILEERKERRPTYVLNRGLYDAPDKSRPVQPGVPSFLPPLAPGATRDRLALARWLVDPSHPLTARVAVSQLWSQLFGVGLVETAENFGLRGAPPSHPRLLDWLATEYVRNGWDTKTLLKTIVMSATYQQQSNASSALIERDPNNTLLARGPRRRLPAEMIRDQALAVSGLLVERIGGPSVRPYQPSGLWKELAGGASQGPYKASSGDDLYRRSLYTNRKRTVPHPTLSIFDAPSFEVCQVRRFQTNTPLQALALLNDVTYVESARKMAERTLRHAADPTARITYAFRLATSRRPSDIEMAILERGLARHLVTYRANLAAAHELLAHGASEPPRDLDPAELAAYAAVASVILNLDETVTSE